MCLRVLDTHKPRISLLHRSVSDHPTNFTRKTGRAINERRPDPTGKCELRQLTNPERRGGAPLQTGRRRSAPPINNRGGILPIRERQRLHKSTPRDISETPSSPSDLWVCTCDNKNPYFRAEEVFMCGAKPRRTRRRCPQLDSAMNRRKFVRRIRARRTCPADEFVDSERGQRARWSGVGQGGLSAGNYLVAGERKYNCLTFT